MNFFEDNNEMKSDVSFYCSVFGICFDLIQDFLKEDFLLLKNYAQLIIDWILDRDWNLYLMDDTSSVLLNLKKCRLNRIS